MPIFGYIFTILEYASYCFSRFFKNKKHMLMIELISAISAAIALYCFNSITGTYNMCLGFILLITASIKESKNVYEYKYELFIYIIFQIGYILGLILTFSGIDSILIFIVGTVGLISIWWLSPQKMRVAENISSFIYLYYEISIKNWAGLLEIFVIFSNIFSFIKYRNKDIEEIVI